MARPLPVRERAGNALGPAPHHASPGEAGAGEGVRANVNTIHIECAVPVRASRAAAWRLLRAKVEAPQQFLPDVIGCDVVERRRDEVVRRVTFHDGMAVTERVELLPEEEVVFRLVDHPKFDGEIHNVLFQSGDVLWLSFYFQGQGKPGVELGDEELAQLRDGFARAVLNAALQIEEGERTAAEAASSP